MSYRVLVTGSRNWADTRLIFGVLGALLSELQSFTLVHGDCKSGADAIANVWAKGEPVEVERHPAPWRPNGKFDPSAGYKRNSHMVNLGADLCLAFLRPCSKKGCTKEMLHPSHGASHCLTGAMKAGIEHRPFGMEVAEWRGMTPYRWVMA